MYCVCKSAVASLLLLFGVSLGMKRWLQHKAVCILRHLVGCISGGCLCLLLGVICKHEHVGAACLRLLLLAPRLNTQLFRDLCFCLLLEVYLGDELVQEPLDVDAVFDTDLLVVVELKFNFQLVAFKHRKRSVQIVLICHKVLHNILLSLFFDLFVDLPNLRFPLWVSDIGEDDEPHGSLHDFLGDAVLFEDRVPDFDLNFLLCEWVGHRLIDEVSAGTISFPVAWHLLCTPLQKRCLACLFGAKNADLDFVGAHFLVDLALLAHFIYSDFCIVDNRLVGSFADCLIEVFLFSVCREGFGVIIIFLTCNKN